MAISSASTLLAPTIPMISSFNGSSRKHFKGGLDVMLKYNKANCIVFPLCFSHRTMSITAVSSRKQYGALQMDHDMSKGEYGSFRRTIWDLHHHSSRSVVTKASNELSPSLSNFSKYFKMKEKPKWWWRTLASIPYFMPLHIMSRYGEGAQNFLPFLQNFEILANPFSGKELPGWFMLVYCFGIYFLVVRNKKLPHFFRFHVIMAILLDNAVQIVGIVAGWMPYWSKLDAPFWTVVAVGLLLIVVGCIRGALKGTYADTPLFSEAAFIHTSLP